MKASEKSKLLNEAVDLLERVNALQQKALGDSDVCYENHNRIENLIEDLIADIVEFDEEAANEQA
jgi:hypothetical protein